MSHLDTITLLLKNSEATRQEAVENMKTSELVAFYNAVTEELAQYADDSGFNPTKRFSTKATGINRTLRALTALAEVGPAYEDEAQEKGEPARKTRKPQFKFPTTDHVKNVRPNTNRAVLVDMLSTEQGATFEECIEATWGKVEKMTAEKAKKTTYEAIRLLHYYVGYGMTQDSEGRITLVTK